MHRRFITLLANQSAAGPLDPLTLLPALWFDFSDITTLYQTNATTTPVTADGQVIGYVADKSGNGRHFTQATAGKRPAYKTNIQNGLSVARFTSASAQDFASASLAATAFLGADGSSTFFAVLLCTTKVENTLLYHTPASRYAVLPEDNGTIYYDCGNNGTARVSASSTAFRDWSIFCGYRNANTKIEILDNATSVVAKTSSISDGTPSGSGVAYLGSYGSGGYFSQDLAEVLIFNSFLGDANIAAVRNYLNTKWSIF